MNTRFAPALALSLVAALAADAAVSSTSTSSVSEKASASTGQLIVSGSPATGYTGTTTFVRSSGTFYLGTPSRSEVAPLQNPAGTITHVAVMKFDQKLEPITAIETTGIRRAAPTPAPVPQSSSAR